MTVLFKDTFTGTNNTLIASHVPDIGTARWAVVSGSPAGIINNQLQVTSMSSSDSMVLVNVGQANVKFTFTWSGVHAWNGAMLRSNASGSSTYWFGTDGLYDTNGTKIGNMTTPANGDIFVISFNADNTITVMKNGTQVISTSSTTGLTNTYHGFSMGVMGSGFDDVTIEDFSTGTTGTNVSITGVVATSTADALAPVISSQLQANVTGVIANASADTLAPVVTTVSSLSTSIDTLVATSTADASNPTLILSGNTSVTTVIANITVDAISPVLSTDSNVISPLGTSTADALAPNVGSFTSISVNAVIVSANADGINPSVDAVRNIGIETLIADATAEALASMVGSSSSAQITAVIASATSDTLTPIISITQGTLINSVAAELTIDAPSPAIQTDAIISAFIANVIATSMAPTINKAILPEYYEVIRFVLNITRKQTSALDITQRKQSELKL